MIESIFLIVFVEPTKIILFLLIVPCYICSWSLRWLYLFFKLQTLIYTSFLTEPTEIKAIIPLNHTGNIYVYDMIGRKVITFAENLSSGIIILVGTELIVTEINLQWAVIS